MSTKLDSKLPRQDLPIEERWTQHKFDMKLVNPANKRKYTVLVVGSGLAGASAAATLAELGYSVHCFCFQDSPRRAHSIAAQGGINGAKNYQNDGDSVYRRARRLNGSRTLGTRSKRCARWSKSRRLSVGTICDRLSGSARSAVGDSTRPPYRKQVSWASRS